MVVIRLFMVRMCILCGFRRFFRSILVRVCRFIWCLMVLV